jgi:hypothetical protein
MKVPPPPACQYHRGGPPFPRMEWGRGCRAGTKKFEKKEKKGGKKESQKGGGLPKQKYVEVNKDQKYNMNINRPST